MHIYMATSGVSRADDQPLKSCKASIDFTGVKSIDRWYGSVRALIVLAPVSKRVKLDAENMEQLIGLILTLLVMLVAVAGSVLPGIPSTPLILAAAVGHKLYFGDGSVGWVVLGLLGMITAISLVLDYLASVYGARKFGASKWGMFGAILGGIVGIFFSYPGLIIGPFAGALTFEMLAGRKWQAGSKAGVGATIGLVLGLLAKAVACFTMIGIFLVDVLWHWNA